MRSALRWLAHHPARVGLGVALLSALALAGIVDPLSGRVRLRVDPALDEMLPDDDVERRFYESLRSRFGSDDRLVLALHGDTLMSPSGLERLARASARIEALPGVHHVESLATALRLRAVDGDLEISPFLEEVPRSPADLARLRAALLADPLRAGSLISRDATTTALVVTLEEMSEERFLAEELDLRIVEAARAEAGDLAVWSAGTPQVKAEISRILMADLAAMVPAVLGLMTLLSWVFFRSWAAALVPVLTVLVALLWTLGVVAWTGHALNIVTTLVPPLVLILGFAYAIHVAAAHQQEGGAPAGPSPARGDGRERVARVLEKVAFPVAFAALTTIAGFLSLGASELSVIRGFGVYASVGVGASLAATLTVAPALLAIASPPRPRDGSARDSRLDRCFARVGAFDLAHRRWLLGGGLLLLVASLLLSTRIEVNTEVIGNFREDAPVRRGYEAINAHLEGANSFYIMIEGSRPGDFEDPAHLHAVAELQAWLEAQPEIGGTTSLVDYLRVMHAAFVGEGDDSRRLPDSADLTAQLLLLGANEDLDALIDPAHRTATILVRATTTASQDFADLAERIDRRLAALPAPLAGRATGNAILLTRSADRISRGQAYSLVAACAMIGCILVLYFRSLRMGLLALVPNVLPVAVYFGMLGLTGVSLNNATALMGSIVLGVAVDDTIHLLVHYRRLARRLGDAGRAAAAALAEVGRPVTYTTIVVCLGLLVVATSDLKTQAQFGALGAATLAVAWLADLLLTPALCSLFPVRRMGTGPTG